MSIADNTAPAGASRWRWLDRWLEPRWRALLTWVVLAAVTGLALDFGVVKATTERLVALIQNDLAPLLSITVTPRVAWMGMFPPIVFFLCWFPPIALRIGLARGLIWICISAISGSAILSVRPGAALFVSSHVFGLPALAAVGRRSRPWMSLLGAMLALGTLWVTGYIPPFYNAFGLILNNWWAVPLSNLIYGAVMLYGTDLLPRQAGEGQLDEDQR